MENKCKCGHDCHCGGECENCANDVCYDCKCKETENQKDEIPSSMLNGL